MIIKRTCKKRISSRGGYAIILGIFVCLLIGMLFYYRSLIDPGIDIDTGEKNKIRHGSNGTICKSLWSGKNLANLFQRHLYKRLARS
ncbi:MAG: hypothetical protein BWY69_01141 [Planctomycetes bacterium ADurb.Bin401]|nr:MAG: hypothetical protein BWY69_01141 [Planctomycetes bacterium ADurb.Bin401]